MRALFHPGYTVNVLGYFWSIMATALARPALTIEGLFDFYFVNRIIMLAVNLNCAYVP